MKMGIKTDRANGWLEYCLKMAFCSISFNSIFLKNSVFFILRVIYEQMLITIIWPDVKQ
jgi:hypothetical protein